MTSYLDLETVTIDDQLARRVPYALCRYYLALPLAQENGSVSVAMTYPENEKARHILANLLQARVVPVFAPAESLQAALSRTYPPQEGALFGPILAWYDRPEWETAVTTTATALARMYQVEATVLAAPQADLKRILPLAAAGRCRLLVCPRPADPALAALISQATAHLFFAGQPLPAIRRILVVLRGFASDEQLLDWLLPLAWQQQAALTLLPLTHNPGLNIGQYHQPESPAGQHLARCLHRLEAAGLPVDLKFRQGNAIEQVLEEAAGNGYELLALAAEAAGDFAGRVITAIDQHQAHQGRPIFVLKPPELPAGQALLAERGD